jgi:hypothetical protein
MKILAMLPIKIDEWVKTGSPNRIIYKSEFGSRSLNAELKITFTGRIA